MKTFIFVCIAVIGISLLPQGADAYFTTDQKAFTIDGTVGVYTIEFAFGHANHEVKIPVAAVRGRGMNRNALSYDFVEKNSEALTGSSVGVVLSSLPVKDGMYIVPKGKTATFTLLMFYVPSKAEGTRDILVKVTSLPFVFDTTELQLNSSELKNYTTGFLPLTPHLILKI